MIFTWRFVKHVSIGGLLNSIFCGAVGFCITCSLPMELGSSVVSSPFCEQIPT